MTNNPALYTDKVATMKLAEKIAKTSRTSYFMERKINTVETIQFCVCKSGGKVEVNVRRRLATGHAEINGNTVPSYTTFDNYHFGHDCLHSLIKVPRRITHQDAIQMLEACSDYMLKYRCVNMTPIGEFYIDGDGNEATRPHFHHMNADVPQDVKREVQYRCLRPVMEEGTICAQCAFIGHMPHGTELNF